MGCFTIGKMGQTVIRRGASRFETIVVSAKEASGGTVRR
jgi:hypothetical protein